VSKDPIKFAAFLLGRAPCPSVTLHNWHIDLRSLRGQILIALLGRGRTHTFGYEFLDLENAVESLHSIADLVSQMDRRSSLHRFAV